MELSQYVLDTIAKINHFDYDNWHKVDMILKEASQNAEKEKDLQILLVLSCALSMKYNEHEKNYLPMFTRSSGYRTFLMDDFQVTDIELLIAAASAVDPVWMKAQLFDILWLLSKDYRHGQNSVLAYLKWFDDAFDPNKWVKCDQIIRRALDISKQLGKSTQDYKQVRQTINQAIFELNGTDPLFLSINLIELVLPDASHEDAEKYLHLVNKIIRQRIDEQNKNLHLVEETFSIQRSLLKRLNYDEDIIKSYLNLGDYYEKQADKLLDEDNVFSAIVLLKKACSVYSKIKCEKLLAVRAQISQLQKKTINLMKPVPFEVNVQPIREAISRLFSGLTLQETIIQFGRFVPFYKVEEVEQGVIEEQKQFIFKSLFPSAVLNAYGQVTENIPPLDIENPTGNPDLFHKHMVYFVSERRRFGEAIALNFAYRFLQGAGTLNDTDLDFLIYDNPIIPDGREEIIRIGLYLGLSGRLYASMHILLPQMEHMIRTLVDLCGDTVTFLKDDGKEEYKPLSQLFKSEKLHECYSEDIIFTFHSIMDDPAGENLRNLNAHGLLDANIGNSESAFHFLCLVIKFLSLYSPAAYPILEKLSVQDPVNDD